MSHNYLDWAKYQNRHSSKRISVTKLVFCRNESPIRGSFWQKDSLITHILFELAMPILIFSPVQIIMRHPLISDAKALQWKIPLSNSTQIHSVLWAVTNLPYAHHYKPRLVFFYTQFSLWLRLILQTIYVLKMEILHFLSSKSAAYKREWLQIESGLWWRAYGKHMRWFRE